MLAEALKEKGLQVIAVGSAVKDGTIAPATRTGYEAGRSLFVKQPKVTTFYTPADELSKFGKVSLMDEQEGLYMERIGVQLMTSTQFEDYRKASNENTAQAILEEIEASDIAPEPFSDSQLDVRSVDHW